MKHFPMVCHASRGHWLLPETGLTLFGSHTCSIYIQTILYQNCRISMVLMLRKYIGISSIVWSSEFCFTCCNRFVSVVVCRLLFYFFTFSISSQEPLLDCLKLGRDTLHEVPNQWLRLTKTFLTSEEWLNEDNYVKTWYRFSIKAPYNCC